MGTPLLESYYSYYRMAITNLIFNIMLVLGSIPCTLYCGTYIKKWNEKLFSSRGCNNSNMLHKNKKHLPNIFGRSKKNCTVCLLPNCLAARKEKFTNSKKNLKGRIFLCASIFYIMGKISISFFSINKIIQITLLISCQGNIDRYVELMIFYSFLSIPDI